MTNSFQEILVQPALLLIKLTANYHLLLLCQTGFQNPIQN